MSKRFIKVARKYFESEEWLMPRKFSEPEAWIDMVQLASFADHDITLSNGGYITLYRGEFYYTMRQLAKRWGWSLGGVQRYFARLAEGDKPRIERIARDTRFDTPSDTQFDTQVIVVRLCNYTSYNEAISISDTPSDTPSDTQVDTLNKKGYNKKGNNNTHTSYLVLRDLFVQACMREAYADAARTAEEMALLTQADEEAAREHNTRCRRSPQYNLIFWLWWKYADLQVSFEKPLHPEQAQELLCTYKLEDIGHIVESIYNKRNAVHGRSFFHTIKQWAKQDFTLKS